MHSEGISAGRRHVFGRTSEDGTRPSADSSIVLHGSVSGYLNVAEGQTVCIDGVLEDALIIGKGQVHVAGLISEIIPNAEATVMASPGSVTAPERADGVWRVLGEDGVWEPVPHLVFPDASTDGPWFPLPPLMGY